MYSSNPHLLNLFSLDPNPPLIRTLKPRVSLSCPNVSTCTGDMALTNKPTMAKPQERGRENLGASTGDQPTSGHPNGATSCCRTCPRRPLLEVRIEAGASSMSCQRRQQNSNQAGLSTPSVAVESTLIRVHSVHCVSTTPCARGSERFRPLDDAFPKHSIYPLGCALAQMSHSLSRPNVWRTGRRLRPKQRQSQIVSSCRMKSTICCLALMVVCVRAVRRRLAPAS